jgi:hypothetical protein
MPVRYIVMGVFAVVIQFAFAEIVGKYNQKFSEILSMDMVFVPVVFCIMIVLEGVYQMFFRNYE